MFKSQMNHDKEYLKSMAFEFEKCDINLMVAELYNLSFLLIMGGYKRRKFNGSTANNGSFSYPLPGYEDITVYATQNVQTLEMHTNT